MPKKGLLSVDQAISAIVKKISLLKKEEKIRLSDSLGRILSKNVLAVKELALEAPESFRLGH